MAYYYAKRISTVKDKLMLYRISATTSLTNTAGKDPLCAIESYETVFAELKKKEDYKGDLERSFINRALSGFLVSLNLQRNFENYRQIYEQLVNITFKDFGIGDHPKEYYHREWMYEDYLLMLETKPEDFVTGKLKLTSDRLKERSSTLTVTRMRRDEMKERLKAQIQEKRDIIEEQNTLLASKPVRLALKFRTFVRRIMYGKA